MKKQMHILEGLMILVIVFISFLFIGKFIHHIKNEKMDTSYMWNITLNNLEIKEGSKGNVTYNKETLNVDVVLKEFNEFAEFTIDIENNGTIDAVLEEYVVNVNNPTNILTYEIAYEDGNKISEGDILPSKSKKEIRVKILYPVQESKIYPALELNLSFNMHYIAKY